MQEAKKVNFGDPIVVHAHSRGVRMTTVSCGLEPRKLSTAIFILFFIFMASEAETGGSAKDGSTIIIAIVAPSVFLIVAILLIVT
jgi:hypothetical protein